MQSHASRHVCSEFLQDLHPDLSAPFPKEVIKDEIAVAYGRRSITKLIAVLSLEESELTDEQRAHALRVFNGLLSTQEQKTDAINAGAAPPLTKLVRESRSMEVRTLSCEALASMAQVLPGRLAIVDGEAYGMESLTAALLSTPEAAAGALRQFSVSNDGIGLLNKVLPLVVPALVSMINQPPEDKVPLKACANAAATLAGIASTDEGIMACLTHHVPAAIVSLANRGIKGDYQLEANLMDALEDCAVCLEQLAHHPYGKTALRECEGIKLLGTMLTQCVYHRGCLLHITSALMGASIEKESKLLVMVYAGLPLTNILKSSKDERLVANARAAVASASEHLEARSITQQLLSEKEMVELVFKGPAPPTPPDFRYRVVLPYEPTA